MTFEVSNFGYAGGATTADSYGVHTHYGPREVRGSQGIMNTSGAMNELVLDLDGAMLTAEEFPLIAPIIPINARIEDVFFEVQEVFVMGGTTPALEVGTETSEATNGFSVTEAQLEAVGTYDLTGALSGTWSTAVGLAAATTLGIALSGTTPTSTTAGKARVVIRYVKV